MSVAPLTKSRVEAFSDGVIAIIITIMVLELKTPDGFDLAALMSVAHIFLLYVLSFIYVGIYWNNHHHLMHAVSRINGGVLWANLHLLFWLSLVPFTTRWMGESHLATLPVAVYGVSLLMPAIAYYILVRTLIAANGRDSAAFRSYVAGLIRFMPQISPMWAPNVNSFRRMRPDSAAPINVQWGVDNRSCGFRIPVSDKNNRRVENRLPGADSNPYLAIAASLVCGYIGMVDRMVPPKPITGSAYSVSAFTHWSGDSIAHIWLKSLASAPPRSGDFFGARAAPKPYHPIETIDPAPATEQLGIAGPWHERLPHFRMAFTPSVGAELQTEYFVPFTDGPAALRALHAVQDQFNAHLMVSELRTIAADELWMSMNYRRPSLAFHFTWQPDWPAVQKVLPAIEAALAPFGVRPHWGKLFTMPKAILQSRYERLGDFRALLAKHDAAGKFRNRFLDDTVF